MVGPLGRAVARACAAVWCVGAPFGAGVPDGPRELVREARSDVAQPLNLDQGAAPLSAGGSAAREIADQMSAQAKSIAIGGAIAPADAVRAALRRTASTLILWGERQGAKGSVHMLVGGTIAARIGALDAALAGELATLDPATLLAAAKDLGAIGPDASLANYESIEDLDRALRDALAPLAQVVSPMRSDLGWVIDRGANAPGDPRRDIAPTATGRASLADLARALGLSPEAGASFGDLDSRLALADQWLSFAGWAAEVRAQVRSAAFVAGSSKPAWLNDAAYGLLRVELVRAVGGMAGASSSDAGRGTDPAQASMILRKLAALGELIRAADAVDATASGRSTRTTRAALGELIVSAEWTTDPSLDQRLDRVASALRIVVRGAEEIPERTVVRQLRPALASLEPAARQASLQMLDILPRLVRRPDAMADPAYLGAVAAHAQRSEDLRLAATMSDLLTGRRYAPSAARAEEKSEIPTDHPLRPIAERALVLGQDFAKATKRDAALVAFRDLAQQLAWYLDVAGERELRAEIQPGNAPGDWAALTGSREKKIVTALGEARSRWLSERAGPRTQPSARGAMRLDNLRRAVGFFRDAAAVRAMLTASDHAGTPLQAWPAWELSKEAMAALCTGLNDRSVALAEKVVAGDEEGVSRALQSLSSEFAVVPLIARLDRGLREFHAVPMEQATAGALSQVALGPPPRDAWLVGQRDQLAAICRYSEELARAEARADSVAATSWRGLVNRAAAAVSASMDASEQ